MKKEVQQTIIEKKSENATEEEFYSMLKLVVPGTILRKALDSILNYGKGALIVIDSENLAPLIDGGFRVNCKFSYQKLVELSKMDGAIILSKDLKKINFANVLLTPSSKIKTFETGTRHKAAERTAKQISGLAIAISERKKEIILFYKDRRMQIKDSGEVADKVLNYMQFLEKQRELFDSSLERLNKLELRNYINLVYAVKTIQKGKIIKRISEELSKYLIELGNEGNLIRTRLKELLNEVERETDLVIKDYSKKDHQESVRELNLLSYEDLLEKDNIIKRLGYENLNEVVNVAGWRILSKTLLSESEIENLINEVKKLEIINTSEIDKEFASIPKDKFSHLKVELERLKLGV